MMALLSPSKSMDMEMFSSQSATQPDFLAKSETLIDQLRKMKTDELGEFMEISNKLATLNQERFKNWMPKFTTKNAKPALLAFTGDVYDGPDAPTLETSDQAYAQDHLRILSGLYGILRPLDLIQAYRLEMGRPLKTKQASNLFAFWRESIDLISNKQPMPHSLTLHRKNTSKPYLKKSYPTKSFHPSSKMKKTVPSKSSVSMQKKHAVLWLATLFRIV